MSIFTNLDKMFYQMDMNIYNKIAKINDVYDCDKQKIELITVNNSVDTLCEERDNLSRKLRSSLENHMHWANEIREKDMTHYEYKTDEKFKQRFYDRNKTTITKLDDNILALKTTKKIPTNIFDIIFLTRLEKTEFCSNRSLSASFNLMAKDFIFNPINIDIVRENQYVWVRDVVSLNDNNFLVVLNSFKHQDKIEIISMNGEYSIFPEFLVSTSKYKILAPVNTNRIILKYATKRSCGSGFFSKNLNRYTTFIQIYDYKLNLLVSKSFDECYVEIFANSKHIVCRSDYDTKVVFFDYYLNIEHVCNVGYAYDKYQMRHFHGKLVYFGKTLKPIHSESYTDIFVIYDVLDKREINKMENKFLKDVKNDQLSVDPCKIHLLYWFDRDSNIFIYNNKDTLNGYDKNGSLLYTENSPSLSKTFSILASIQNWSVSVNNERTTINAFNINNNILD